MQQHGSKHLPTYPAPTHPQVGDGVKFDISEHGHVAYQFKKES